MVGQLKLEKKRRMCGDDIESGGNNTNANNEKKKKKKINTGRLEAKTRPRQDKTRSHTSPVNNWLN